MYKNIFILVDYLHLSLRQNNFQTTKTLQSFKKQIISKLLSDFTSFLVQINYPHNYFLSTEKLF